MDLFLKQGAMFNDDRTKRNRLWRIWDETKPLLIAVMMNPSDADEEKNDPTVERIQVRARMLDLGGIAVVNLMDVVETDSKKLDAMTEEERSSAENKAHLHWALERARFNGGQVLCAWGKPGHKYGPVDWFQKLALDLNVPLYCLKKNKDGSPVHPLYISYNQPLKPY